LVLISTFLIRTMLTVDFLSFIDHDSCTIVPKCVRTCCFEMCGCLSFIVCKWLSVYLCLRESAKADKIHPTAPRGDGQSFNAVIVWKGISSVLANVCRSVADLSFCQCAQTLICEFSLLWVKCVIDVISFHLLETASYDYASSWKCAVHSILKVHAALLLCKLH
jgi:hypothetical protein